MNFLESLIQRRTLDEGTFQRVTEEIQPIVYFQFRLSKEDINNV